MADADKICAAPLGALGFRKRAGGIFTIEIVEDVIGVLGLNKATRYRSPGEVEVNPLVGVRHQGVERVVAECLGEKFHAYIPPTVSTPIGYLLPEKKYTAWVFGSRGEIPDDDIGANLAAAVAEYGVPFMRATAELPELCRRLDEGLTTEFEPFRGPVAHLLAGDAARARTEVERHLATITERTDPAADEYRTFAVALRQRIDAGF